MENQSNLKNIAIQYGVSLGVAIIVVVLLAYAIDIEWMVSYTLMFSLFLLSLVISIMGGIKHRKQLGGYMKFGEAWKALFFVYIIGAVISTLFSALLYGVIDPGLGDAMYEAVVEKTMGLMESFGAPEEALDQTMKALEESKADFGVAGQIQNSIKGILFMAVILLIPALIIKKNVPEETTLDSE